MWGWECERRGVTKGEEMEILFLVGSSSIEGLVVVL